MRRKTPIVIRTDLPENVEFVIQSQKDYERQEQERLLDKFFRMFGDWRMECKVIYVEDLEVGYEIVVWEVKKDDYSKSR